MVLRCQCLPCVAQVAEEECKHHRMLETRLHELGSSYGAFPVHDALWYAQMSLSWPPTGPVSICQACNVQQPKSAAEHLLTVCVYMWALTFYMCPAFDMLYTSPLVYQAGLLNMSLDCGAKERQQLLWSLMSHVCSVYLTSYSLQPPASPHVPATQSGEGFAFTNFSYMCCTHNIHLCVDARTGILQKRHPTVCLPGLPLSTVCMRRAGETFRYPCVAVELLLGDESW